MGSKPSLPSLFFSILIIFVFSFKDLQAKDSHKSDDFFGNSKFSKSLLVRGSELINPGEFYVIQRAKNKNPMYSSFFMAENQKKDFKTNKDSKRLKWLGLGAFWWAAFFDHYQDAISDRGGKKEYIFGADDQWLYLPALKRVKKISSNNKSGPFMGSEFAFEDLSSQEVEKYTYKYLGDDVLDGINCFMLERDPVDPKSGYTVQIVWIDKEDYKPLKVDYYDRKSSLLKTLTFSNYKQYLDKYWRASEMNMVNHQTGKSTQLIWSDYKFATGLTERDFDKNSLKRAR